MWEEGPEGWVIESARPPPAPRTTLEQAERGGGGDEGCDEGWDGVRDPSADTR